jgi:hypothetical protein
VFLPIVHQLSITAPGVLFDIVSYIFVGCCHASCLCVVYDVFIAIFATTSESFLEFLEKAVHAEDTAHKLSLGKGALEEVGSGSEKGGKSVWSGSIHNGPF